VGIRIQENVSIGAGARILDGMTIGRDSVVGAGNAATYNAPPFEQGCWHVRASIGFVIGSAQMK
jgi:serine acetyltransferase